MLHGLPTPKDQQRKIAIYWYVRNVNRRTGTSSLGKFYSNHNWRTQRANSSELLRCLQTRKQFGSKFKVGPRQEKETALKEQPPLDKGRLRDRFSLSNDIVAVRIVRDINEELHMILHVIEQQSKVLRDSGHPHENIWEQDLNDFKTRIDKLSLEATSINELVSLPTYNTYEPLRFMDCLLILRSYSKRSNLNKHNLARAKMK